MDGPLSSLREQRKAIREQTKRMKKISGDDRKSGRYSKIPGVKFFYTGGTIIDGYDYES